MRCSDLNINYTDEKQGQFQLGVWNDPDNQKFVKIEEETRRRFKDNALVHNRLIKVSFPSLSMTLYNDDDKDLTSPGTLIAELVYWDYKL